MSYDIEIRGEHTNNRNSVAKEIEAIKEKMNVRFEPEDKYYLHVDLELVATDGESIPSDGNEINCVRLSIPYAKFNRNHVDFDFDIYFNFAQDIATYCGYRAYDCQLDIYMDTAEFERNKPKYNHSASAISQIKISDDTLIFSREYMDKQIRWDYNSSKFLAFEDDPDIREERGYAIDHPLVIENESFKVMTQANKSMEVLDKQMGDVYTIKRCGEVNNIAFYNHKHLLTASNNRSLKLWNLESRKAVKTFKGHEDYISDFKVIDKKILVSSSSGAINFWDIQTGKMLCTLLFAYSKIGDWLCVTPEGDYDCSETFKGTMRWDYGKYNYVIGEGIGFDSQGRYSYKLVEGTCGQKVDNLLGKMIVKRLEQ